MYWTWSFCKVRQHFRVNFKVVYQFQSCKINITVHQRTIALSSIERIHQFRCLNSLKFQEQDHKYSIYSVRSFTRRVSYMQVYVLCVTLFNTIKIVTAKQITEVLMLSIPRQNIVLFSELEKYFIHIFNHPIIHCSWVMCIMQAYIWVIFLSTKIRFSEVSQKRKVMSNVIIFSWETLSHARYFDLWKTDQNRVLFSA